MVKLSTTTCQKGFSVLSLIVLALSFIISTNSNAQTGTEFWFAPPEVTSGHGSNGGLPILLRLATGDDPATITISQPANGSFTPIVINLAANSSTTEDLSAFENDLETRPANTVLNTGLLIESTAEITAYYEVSTSNNPDIWALKGENGLGTEFYAPIQNLWPNGTYTPTPYTSFDIVATEDNTTVLVYPTEDLDGGQPAFQSFTITLDRGETYSASVTNTSTAANNPSGSIIVSDKPIAVSIKDDSIRPTGQGCRDLNGDQIVPVDIVGDEYIVNKGGLTAATEEYAYVIATQNNTVISIDGVVETTLFNAETYPILITNDLTYITGDKPFYLIHISGFGCESGMAILPPLNCAGSEAVNFVRSSTQSFFINLLVPSGSEDAFVLNGDPNAIDPADFQAVPGTGGAWVGAQIQFNNTEIPQGQQNLITNTEEVFSLGLINGGASTGCRFGYFSEFAAEIIVDAGPDQTVCANRETELDGSVSGGATQGIWSTNGTGAFVPDATALDATYEPSAADLSAGTVTLTLTSVSNCFPVEDEVVITYTPAPVVLAGDDIEACENNTTVTLDGFVDVATGGIWSGGDGTFSPTNGTLDAEYTPSAAEVTAGSVVLTLTSTGNGTCFAEEDSVEITFGPAPTADAGMDQVLCGNNAQAQLLGSVTIAGGGQWTGGTGTFSPSDQSLSPTYTPSPTEILNGSVTLTLNTTDNGGCNPVTDDVLLTFTPAPTVDAGSDQTLCENNADVNLDGTITVATGGTWSGGAGTFTPDANTIDAIYTPTLAELLSGSITLTLTSTGNGDCLPVSDDITINFTDAPIVDAGADANVCSNNPDISLNGSLIGASFGIWSGGGGSFTPNTTTLNAVYTPTPAEISSGSVTLTLTSLDNGTCNAVSDDVTFTFTPSPTANAGADQDACENNPAVTLAGAVTIASGGQWSGGAGTFTPDANTLNATYTPTAGEITTGSVTLTLTTTGNGNCSPVADDMVINFTPAPTANAGTDQTLCANNADVSLNGSVTIAAGGVWTGGLGIYSPDANALNATYQPTASEIASGSLTLTLTTTGNGDCNPVSDDVVITFTDAPVVDAGTPISVCENNAQVTLAGSVVGAGGGTWSGGAGTFIPNGNALNALYNPTPAEIAAGSLILTLTSTGNGNCNPVEDVVTITFTDAPTANAGADQTVCGNDADVNLNGSVTIASGGVWSGGSGTFTPNNTSLGATYTPSAAEIAAGTVTLTLTTTGNGTCNAVDDQMTITITPAPTVEAGSGEEVCSNNPDISLNGSVTVASGGTWSGGSGTFTPDASTLNATYTPSQSEINNGSVTLTLTSTGNGDCIAVSDNVTYTFGPSPTANAGPNQTLCSNNADVSLAGSVTVAGGGQWSGGAGTFTPTANALNATYTPTAAEIASGSLTLTLTTTGNGDCLAATDDMTITFTPAPTSNPGPDQTVCANDPEVNLNGSVTVATGGTWSGGFGTFNPDANTLFTSYTPSGGEIAAGSVTLTLTTTGNGNCAAVSEDINITITPAPVVNAGADDTYCANNPDISLSGSVTVASGGVWSGGSGTYTPDATDLNAVYTPTQSEINNGSVTLTLTSTGNGDCVAVSDNVTFTFTPAPTVNAGPNQTLCANNAEVSLSGSVTVAGGGTWSGGAGTFSPNANTLNATYTPTAGEIASGSLTLTLTSTGNGDCIAVSDDMTVTFTPAPTSNPGPDQTVCANDPAVNLNGSVTIATGGTWSGGFGTFNPDANTLFTTYTPSGGEIAAGTVTLTLTTTGNGNCTAVSEDITITITPAPTVNAGADDTYCGNNADISLAGTVTVASGGVWSGGSGTYTPSATDLNAVYTPTQSEINNGSVTLTLTSTGNGDCIAVSDDVTFTFTDAPTADAGADIEVCSNNADVSLSGSVTIASGGVWSGGAGTFTPNANTLNATYTPTAAEIASGSITLTLTTTGNGDCNAVSDEVDIDFSPSPTANAGLDQTVCANNPDVVLNGQVTVASGGTWSGGNGVFTPNNTTLGAVYTPSAAEIAAGSVTLILTTTGNGDCNAVADQMTITITPAPVVDAGVGFELCANNPDITLSGSVVGATGGSWSGGSGTFTPDANTLNAVYTPSAGEISSGSLTLTLTSTGNGNCLAVSDAVTYTFGPSPTVNAGPDQTICENNADVTLAGAITNAGGGTWSGGAGTFAPNANTLNAVYTPTSAELALGSVTLTLTSTGNGNCIAVSDDMTISFTPAPTASAGADQTVCGNDPEVNLSGSVTVATGGTWSGGFGTFSPDANSLFTTYTPSLGEIAAGTVTLTLTTTGVGNCTPVTDDITITITPAPVVDAGADATFCANNSDIELEGTVTVASGGIWSGGNGTFTPNASTLDAIYTPSIGELTAGSVTLTLTSTGNGDCIAESDNVTFTFTQAPTVNAGADQTLCSNNSEASLSGSVTIAGGATWSGGAGTFSPSANSLNATYTPTAAELASGSVTLTLTSTGNGTCNPVSDDITITYTPSPTANAGADQSVCANNPTVNLGGSVTIATGGTWSGGFGTFSPDANALFTSYTPTPVEIANGSVTLTLTTTGNGNCAPVTDNITITITPSPTVDAGTGSEFCANNADIPLSGSVSVASGGTWSGGSGSFTPNANDLNAIYIPSQSEINSGSVTLTLTSTGNGNCLAVTDNVTYTFSPAPTVDAGADQTICSNNSNITLNGSVSGAGGITWSGGAGTFTPNANTLNAVYSPTPAEISSGAITLTISTTGNGDCLPETDEVDIIFTPAPTADAGPDQSVCANNPNVNLNGFVTIASGGAWSGGNGVFTPNNTTLGAVYTPSVAEISAGTVTLTLTTTGNGNCTPVTDQIQITITPAPTVDAGTGFEVCANDPSIDLSGTITIASGGTWSGGNGTFTPDANDLNAVYTPSQSEINNGSVTLTLTSTGNGNCAQVSDNVTYTFGPAPIVDAGPDQTLCANNADVSLDGTVTLAGGGTWSGGAGTFTPNANTLDATYTPTPAELSAGSVTLTLTSTGNGNCLPESDDVTITFTPAPTADAGSDQTVCGNDPSVNLNGQVTLVTGGVWTGGNGIFNPNNTTLGAVYTPSPAEIASGSVTLTLTTTGNGNCVAVSDQMTITIDPSPIVDAGIGEELCANNAAISLNGSILNAGGGTWTGGSGTFNPDANTLNASYTPSQSEIDNGSVTLTLTSTGNGDCLPESDNVTYTFGPAPTADAGPDQSLCANNSIASLSGSVTIATGGVWSGGAGVFAPNANSLNATYTPTPAELAAGFVTLNLSTTGNGDCLPATDNITLNFTPAPTASAGSDQTVCANNPDVSLSGSVTIATGGSWSGGDGVFSPSNDVLNPTYTPSAAEIAAGTVSLTLTTTGNGTCNPVSDNVIITITPAPTVDAGTGSDFCANNADITLNGSVTGAAGATWSGGSGTFDPNANDLNAIYTPAAGEITSGSVTLTLTTTGNGNCLAVTDNVIYTFSPAPVVDAGEDQDICSNNTDISLAGSVTGASGGVWSGGAGTFVPSANTLNAVYTPTPAEIAGGTLVLTLTSTGNGNCNPVSDDVEITFTPAPTANAGLDQTVCANNASVNLNGAVTVASGGSWSGGLGVFTPDANTLNASYVPSPSEIANGSVTLTLTTTGNDNCSPVSDQMTITITPAPIVDAGVGIEYCENNPDISLAGTVTGATGGTWSGGSGTFTPSASDLNAVYTPSAGEIVDGSITLTLTSTGNGNCLAVTDDVTFTFGPAPTANAGMDLVLCSNNADVSLNGIVTGAAGGTWSGGAGTFAPNPNTLNAVYTPDATDIAAGFVTLTLTTTGNGNCNPVTDQITITFTPAPNVNAGNNQTVCANNADVSLNGSVTIATGGVWSGGLGTFTPDANTLNATYSPAPSEIATGTVTLTLTSTGNGNCNQVSDQITITINPAPVVDAGTGFEVCSNNADINLNGSVTGATGGIWSGGSGTFTPDANTLNAVYTPSAGEITSGSITLTLTSTGNGNCLPVEDIVTYTFGPSPTANAGLDQSLCSNNADVSLTGTVTGASGGEWTGGNGVFTPNNTSLNAVYTPSADELAAGTVTLTLTTTGNGNCNAVSDDVTINFTPSPTANAGADQTVCANDPDVNLNGSVTVATGGSWSGGTGVFSPDANTLNAIYTPSAAEISAGTVTLTLTTTGNGNCLPVTDQITITITPAPIVDAGSGIQLCSNNADIALNGSVTGATGGTWTGGSGTFTPDANTLNAVYTPSASEIASGSLTLTLTSTGNGNCLAVTDQVTFTFGPAPTADAGVNQTLCSNNAEISLTGTVTVASGGVWSGGAGTFSPSPNVLNAVYNPTAAEIASGSITLTLTTTGNGNCNAVSDDVTINFTPSPTANAGADQTVCANDPDVNLNGSVTVATGGSWSGGNGVFSPDANTLNAIYTPSAAEISAGTVTLTLTTTGNGNCLPVTDQITITITPAPVVDAGAGFELCANNADISLNGSVTGATGGTWTGGSGTFTPDANTLNAVYTPSAGEIASGSLTLTLTSTGNGNCLAVTDQVTFTFGPAPTADAGVNQTLCSNNAEISLSGTVTVASGGTWSGGAGTFSPSANVLNPVYTPTAAEITSGSIILTLTTTGNGNCNPVSDDVTINFTPSPTANAGADQTVCANNVDVDLNASISVATGATWSGGTGVFTPDANTLNATYTPSAAEIAAGTVTLTLTTTGNGNCLPVSDNITITITPEPIVNAGADVDVCSNNSEFDLSGTVQNAGGGIWSGGLGSFNPSNTDLNATYTPTTPEVVSGSVTLTLTSTGNGGCLAVADQVTITFTPSPTVDAGEDIALCASSPVATLDGEFTVSGGAQWSGGAGTFAPNTLDMNATYTPTAAEIAAGSVTLTLSTISSGNCLEVSDEVTITYDPEPTVTAGPNLISCANNPDVDLQGAFSNAEGVEWSGGTGFFDPSNEDENATYTPSNDEILNGGATLTLTTFGSGECPDVSDQMNITINPAPIVDAGSNFSVCANNSDANLDGSVQFASGGSWTGGAGIFTPNNNTLDAVYIPTAAEIASGSVTLTLTSTGNGTCDPESDEVTITFTPAPIADAGVDIETCENNASVELAGSFTVAEGANWSGGAGSFNPDNSTMDAIYTPTQSEIASGSVTLTLTTFGNGNCIAVSDQMVITFTEEPVVEAGDDFFACVDDLNAPLSGSVTGATSTGVWSTSGTGIFVPNPTDLNATYQISSADSLAEQVTLYLTSTNNGTCIPVVDSLTVFIFPAGTADAGEDQTLCSNNATASLTGIIGGAATSGVWTTSGTGTFSPANDQEEVNYIPSDEDLANGSVTLTFAVNSCNLAQDDVVITYTPEPVVNAGDDITACSSENEVTLNGSVSGASATGLWTTSGSGTFIPGPDALNATYQWSAQDVEDQVVELVLSATNIGNCLPVSDTLTLNIFPQGTADAGPDVDACANNPEVQLNGTLTGADIPLWTTSGSGSFAPSPDTLNTTYVPSQQDIGNGSVDIVLNAVNSCNNASDFMTITFTPAPTIDAGEDLEACGDIVPFAINGSVSVAGGGVWSTSGSGTFQNQSDLSTFYVASQQDVQSGLVYLILTSTDNGNCFAVADSLALSLNEGITVDAGEDQNVCVDAGQIQLFGSVTDGASTGTWTSTGNGTFSPSADDLNAVYQFTQDDIDAGSVTITLTSTNNGICPEESDSFELTFGTSAFVFAGDDVETCESITSVDLNGIISGETNTGVWTSSGDGVFVPDNTTLNASYEPGPDDISNGSVELTLTSTGSVLCDEGSSTLTVNFLAQPVANAGADQVVCNEIEPVQLTGSVQNALGGTWQTSGSGTFTPNDSLLTALYTPSVADSIIGSVSLTLTTYGSGDCPAITDVMTISFSEAVVPIAGPDQEVCEDVGSVALSGSVEGSDSYQWMSSGTGSFDPSDEDLITNYLPSQDDIDEGSIQIYLEAEGNAQCPAQVDSLTLTFDVLPVITVDSSFDVCITDPDVELEADVDFADSFLWSTDGDGSFTPDQQSETVVYIAGNNDLANGNATITLAATSDGVCGTVEEELEINYRELAIVNAGQDQTICETQTEVQLFGVVDGDGYAGEWTTNDFGDFTPDATQLDAIYIPGANDILIGSASLILNSTNNGPCPAQSDTVVITINSLPTVDAGEDDFVCSSTGSISLNGLVENAESIEWDSDGDGIFLPSENEIDPDYIFGNVDVANGEVDLILTALPLEGCEEVSDTVSITLNTPLEADFAFTPACVEAPVQFTDQTKVLAGSIASWSWNFGNGNTSNQQNPVFAFTQVGTPTVQLVVQSSLGCNDTIAQTINVEEGPTAAFLISENPAPVNFEVDFQNASDNEVAWNWDFGDGIGESDLQNPSYIYPDEGDYVVTLVVTGSSGCLDSAQTTLTISGELILPPRVPNSFSPNGDGTNDVYYVRGGPFIELDFRVYDGWGREIWSTTDQEIGWDGTEGGKQSPVGVYVYTLKATNLEGEEYDFTGRINLLR